jgi:predicted RNA-binding protein with RPS1 domain
MTNLDDELDTDHQEVLMPKTRVRAESVRSFLKAIKALLEQGATIKNVQVMDVNAVDEARARSRAIGGAEPTKQRDAGAKRGRPRVHKQKATETAEEYQRRLARARQQRSRERKKATAREVQQTAKKKGPKK